MVADTRMDAQDGPDQPAVARGRVLAQPVEHRPPVAAPDGGKAAVGLAQLPGGELVRVGDDVDVARIRARRFEVVAVYGAGETGILDTRVDQEWMEMEAARKQPLPADLPVEMGEQQFLALAVEQVGVGN